MIILDTHIWIWWVDENPKLSPRNLEIIQAHQASGLGINIISCWEIAKLVEKGRLSFDCTLEEWLEPALAYPGVELLDLNLSIILQSSRLAGLAKRFDLLMLRLQLKRLRVEPQFVRLSQQVREIAQGHNPV